MLSEKKVGRLGKKQKILVVDDEDFELVRYEKVLGDEGYAVVQAHDGYEALEMVKSAPPDAIVLDIKMPGIDGIETMGKIFEENEEIPVIIHTAFSVWRENFRSRLADAFVVKTRDMGELKTKLREILKSKGKISS
ncbi:response regulator [candidate division KSB1 bacterium]|nr:response regulator [candidate division KSB1 bacterium]